MKNFKEKVVVITGASSGIGASTAKLFSNEGAKLVLVSRSKSKLQQVANEIKAPGREVIIIPTDVTNSTQVDKMVQQILDVFGGIDILFNNAGSSYTGNVSGREFVGHLKKMMEVDLFGTVNCTRAVLPIMQEKNKGLIINMSSVVGKKAFINFVAYSSVMHAISGFTDGLRQELAPLGIRVTTVHPALTRTALLDHVKPVDMPPPFKAMTPLDPQKVAIAILKGVKRKKSRIIVPFQPKILLFLDALSNKIADKFILWISNPRNARLLGMYKGKLYHEM